MSNKLKGVIAGVAASLLAIGAWMLLAMIGFIAGIAGAGMGILFLWAYKKFNKDDKKLYFAIGFAVVLIVIEIIIAELLTVAIVAGNYGLSFNEAFSDADVKAAIVLDIVIGLVLSMAVFVGYIFSLKRKGQLENNKNRVYSPLNANNQENKQREPFEEYAQTEQQKGTESNDGRNNQNQSNFD